MLHKKQENILETQSIRKTAPTNHASLDRFKKNIATRHAGRGRQRI